MKSSRHAPFRAALVLLLPLICLAITNPAYALPAASMDLVYEQRTGNDRVYVVNPDHDSVTVVDAIDGRRLAEIRVGDEPRSLALDGLGYLWVINKNSASISIIDVQSLTVVNTLPGPYGSRPHGVAIDTEANRAYVVLEATGTLFQIDTISGALIRSTRVGNTPREVSISRDGSRVYVPSFITPPVEGENGLNPANGSGQVSVLSASNLSLVDTIEIPFNRAASGQDNNNSARGVPNYLRALAISPTGNRAWLPSKIDNIYRGSMRDGRGREHNLLTRGILSQIDLSGRTEQLSRRVQFANNSHPVAVTYSPDSRFIYVIHEGSRAFEVINAATGSILHETTLGFAPTGVAVSSDGRAVYVHNWLSRSLSVLDVSALVDGVSNNVRLSRTVNLVNREALSPEVLLGKRLFHDSADPRMSAQRYISCASCHDEGGQDGRVYDFSDVGEGLRNTADMRGRGNMEDGLVHWTANFDEIQDFEHALREIFGGQGLMSDADFAASSTAIDLNGMKTGRSAPLDALAAFVDTLDNHGRSPFRQSSGALTAQGLRGRQVFENTQCASCHSGGDFTDSPLGGSHDIGTVDAATGGRFGQPLINGGLDTPTLKGLWNSAPYLHDGGARTVRQAIEAHTRNVSVSTSSLSPSELDDLASYVLQIDDTEAAPQIPDTGPLSPDTFTTFSRVTIDGNMGDWSTEARLINDPRDTSGSANPLDYETVWMANDQNRLYIRYRNHPPANARLSWGYGQAIDVDGAGNGYRPSGNRVPIGVDFLIEEQSLYRYTGNGSSWSWAWVATLPIRFNARDAELSVSRSQLGNPEAFDLFFYADNTAVGGTQVDFIPDSVSNTGASLDTRFFRYQFAGGTAPDPDPPAGGNPVVFNNPVRDLTIDGNSSDWLAQNVAFFDEDPDDVPGSRNQIDYLQAGVAHDSNNFYFGWNNDGPTQITWGNAIYVDSDVNSSSGFRGFDNDAPIGIDFLIEASSVYRYTGNGNSWQWQWTGSTTAVSAGNSVEIQVPAALLGSPATIDLFFYGDSAAIGGSGVDFYPDEASDFGAEPGTRRFRYSRDASVATLSTEFSSRQNRPQEIQ